MNRLLCLPLFAPLPSWWPERQKKWRERFGEYTVLCVGYDEVTTDELIERNKACLAAQEAQEPAAIE